MKTFKQTKSSIKLDRRIVMKKLNAVVALELPQKDCYPEWVKRVE